MIISKRKGYKFDQNDYDQFFNKIEYNLRELGFGDVSVNKKMKELNQILYDILLKLELKNDKDLKFFKLNPITVKKYFVDVNLDKKSNFNQFESYFRSFFNYCFELSPKNMLEELNKFKY